MSYAPRKTTKVKDLLKHQCVKATINGELSVNVDAVALQTSPEVAQFWVPESPLGPVRRYHSNEARVSSNVCC